MKKKLPLLVLFSSVFLFGCEPEVGSEAWCDAMKKKPKGEWTANEAGEFAKSCVFRSGD